MAERGCARGFRLIVHGHRVAVAVERALERVGLASARHRLRLDVGSQFPVLAAELVAVVDVTGKDSPPGITVDKIRFALCAIACEGDRCSTTACHVGSMAAYVGGIIRAGYFAGVVVVVIEFAPSCVLVATDGTVGAVFDCGYFGTDGEVPIQDAKTIAADAAVVHIFCNVTTDIGRRLADFDGTGAVFNFATVALAHDAAVVIDFAA